MDLRAAAAYCAAFVALTGCAGRRPPSGLAYRLHGPVVTPPEPGAGGSAQIRKARATRKKNCDVAGQALDLRWKGRSALLKLGDTGSDDQGRLPLALLDEMNRFRDAVLKMETNGCIKAGEGARILTAVTERLALPSSLSFELVHASSGFQGFVEVQAPLRLKVVGALMEGSRIAGFETARYAVESGKLRLLGVERSVPGAWPRAAAITTPKGTKYLRLFFLTRRSAADHDALLVAAPDGERLAAATAAIAKVGQDFCARPEGVTCVKTPGAAAVSVEMPVRANGTVVGIPVRGTVTDALRAAGVREPAAVLPSLTVTRLYGGQPIPVQFDASRRDILGLVPIGGEELTWR